MLPLAPHPPFPLSPGFKIDNDSDTHLVDKGKTILKSGVSTGTTGGLIETRFILYPVSVANVKIKIRYKTFFCLLRIIWLPTVP